MFSGWQRKAEGLVNYDSHSTASTPTPGHHYMAATVSTEYVIRESLVQKLGTSWSDPLRLWPLWSSGISYPCPLLHLSLGLCSISAVRTLSRLPDRPFRIFGLIYLGMLSHTQLSKPSDRFSCSKIGNMHLEVVSGF